MHKVPLIKRSLSIGVCLLLVAFGVERSISAAKPTPATTKTAANADGKKKKEEKPTKPSGKKANAKQLLENAKKSLAFMVKSARADKGLDAKVPKNKPFWKATQKISKSIDRAEKGFAAKSDDFFLGVSDARSAE